MGSFVTVISGTGGHGCSREVKDGGHVLGCQRPDCPDCIAREFVRRYKRNGITDLRAELVHWPLDFPGFTFKFEDGELKVEGQMDVEALKEAPLRAVGRYALISPNSSTVIDNLVTGVRTGSF
jgi:hypothetical protein